MKIVKYYFQTNKFQIKIPTKYDSLACIFLCDHLQQFVIPIGLQFLIFVLVYSLLDLK